MFCPESDAEFISVVVPDDLEADVCDHLERSESIRALEIVLKGRSGDAVASE